MPYLDQDSYALLSIAPSNYVPDAEIRHPGWIDGQLAFWSAWLDARLKKRYAAPFEAPPNTPPVICGWLARILDEELYLKVGVEPTDRQFEKISERATEAKQQVQEAADAEKGLYELPLRADLPAATGVTRGGPLGYTEVSPYTWSDVQRELAQDEGP